MNEFEDRLSSALKAAAPPPPHLIDPRAVRAAGRPRRSRRRGVLAPVTAVAVVVTIAVAALIITRHHSDGNTSALRTTAAPNALTRSTHLGVTLTYPASWRLAPVTFINAGVDYPISYITNEPLVSECRAGCGPPVKVLTPGGVIITLNDGPDFVDGYEHTANTTVAGRPAHVMVTKGACSVGGTISTQAMISLSPDATKQRMLDIEACADDPDGRIQAAINQMLKTATFTPR
jgi:hypothetical protein